VWCVLCEGGWVGRGGGGLVLLPGGFLVGGGGGGGGGMGMLKELFI